MRLHIATTRPVGEKCKEWALACGAELVSPEECEVYISILSSQILTPEFLRGRRAYNFHPAILPQYGGSPVYTMVLLNKERESGVTLHEIDEGIDTGANIAVETFPIEETDTATDVRDKAESLIYRMFQRWYFPLIDNTYRRVYRKKELGELKDLTPVIRALTLDGKEPAYWINSSGEKIHIPYE